MSGNRLTAGQRRPCAWLLPALLLLATRASGQGEVPSASAPGTEPIALSADRVTYWDEGPRRWVLLEGSAAVFQGADGLRAAIALARVDTRTVGGLPTFHAEVYTEGDARLTERPDQAHASLRAHHSSQTDVKIRANSPGALRELEGAPPGLALLQRGFPDAVASRPVPSNAPNADPAVQPTQFDDGDLIVPEQDQGFAPGGPFGFDEDPSPDLGVIATPNAEDLLPPSELPPVELPTGEGVALPPVGDLGAAPLMPGSRRIITISPRDSGQNFQVDPIAPADDSGRVKILIRGGVRLVAEEPGKGIIDVSADNAVIWAQFGPGFGSLGQGAVSTVNSEASQPFEVYLDGHVVFRQDLLEVAGDGDQKEVLAERFYMDLRKEWWLAEQAELRIFDSGFITPIKTKGEVIRQYRPILASQDGKILFGPTQIQADRTMVTGSRFPEPGYRFQSRTVDLTQVYEPLINPYTGRPAVDPDLPGAPRDKAWRIDARQNFFFLGPVPIFFWPRFVTESDKLDPPIEQIQYRFNNYFGHQVLTDWSMFKLFGARQPYFVDGWNLDLDYLSERGFAAGSELGWAGKDLIGNILDPYNRRSLGRDVDRPYLGYFNVWGLKDSGIDVLGTGRAVVTDGPPWSDRRFFRDRVPPFQDFRGRVLMRHMQSFLPSTAPFDEDFRLQFEAAYVSDRHFLEQYYKRLFDVGLDQATLAYMIYQRENTALTLLTQGNLLSWDTQSQYFPKLDYYRLGDSIFGDYFTYYQNSGIDYANTHTAVEVNNPNVFSFLPFDPVSATSGPFRTGRVWTSHELDLPINLGFLRLVPYVQGQFVGWDNQYQDSLPPLTLFPDLPSQAYIRGPQGANLGRIWGAAGGRLNLMAWRVFPGVESELLNLHGLGHKINFDVDYRTTYSNVDIGRIGVQDTIDDSTYEFVRRYFAMEQYGTILPPQYDPRLLTLRRTISPITGTTDIQDDMHTVDFAIRQRLQTRRGPDGRRRIVDIMTLDLATTYFPQGNRDNFGKAFGQNMYNWEWFVGDRTSLQSYGWFEFFDIQGDPLRLASPRGTNDPFGLYVITSQVSINRPPRGNVSIGYSVINTGPIATSALNVQFSYWLSPKWFSSVGTSYDFGNAILLGSTVGITRIGADWLTSIGLSVDPQRDAYTFGFELTPRLSPSLRFGSGGGVARFDSRFAPVE